MGTERTESGELEDASAALELVNLRQGDVAGKELQNRIWSISVAFSRSSLVPEALQEKPYDIQILIDHALRSGITPLTMLRSVYVVKGRLGFAAEFYISQLRRSGAIDGTIHYKHATLSNKMLDNGRLRDIEVMAWAVDAQSGETMTAQVSMRTALAEGWTKRYRNSPNKPTKYETMDWLMLEKRSATFLIRAHWPETLMGFGERDELMDIRNAEAQVVSSRAQSAMDRLNTPPSQRKAEVDQVLDVEAEVTEPVPEEEPEELGDALPEQVDSLRDWMVSEEVDVATVQAAVLEEWGHRSIDGLSKEEAEELLDRLAAGQYSKGPGDGGLFDVESDETPAL